MVPEHAGTHTLFGSPDALDQSHQPLRGDVSAQYLAVWVLSGDQKLTGSPQILGWQDGLNGHAFLDLRLRPDPFWGNHRLSVKQLRSILHQLELSLQRLDEFIRGPQLGALLRVHTIDQALVDDNLVLSPVKSLLRHGGFQHQG